jgi:hypothetical protein
VTGDQPKSVGDEPNDLSHVTHRRLIGILGILLPVLLYVIAGLRPTDELPRWGLLTSVSAYYYTGSVAIFVGVLFALSLFLFSYPGYKGVMADRLVGCLGGAAALGVGLFPTEAPESLSEPNWWSHWMGITHYVSAVLLFGSFILFSVWLFRKSSVPKRRDRPAEKRRRDDVSLICGLTMIVSVCWAVGASIADAPIFLPEAIAILAFATSWLVKGEAYQPVLNVIRRLSANGVEK